MIKTIFSKGDGATDNIDYSNQRHYGAPNFTEALLTVIAAEMKADGRVTRSELDVVKRILLQIFDEATAQQALLRLRDILKSNVEASLAALQISMTVSHTDRVKILKILCEIAQADGIVTQSEVNTIYNIGIRMNVDRAYINDCISRLQINGDDRYGNESNHNRHEQSQGNSVERAYATLGVSANATNSEIKDAYRKLAMKYHPDRVATEGPDAQKEAEKKFKEVQAAYETIKAARGL